MSVERLAFRPLAGGPRAHVPEVRTAVGPEPEIAVAPAVSDPLPGESSDWAFGGLLVFTALLFFRPQDQLPLLGRLHLAEVSAVVGLSAMAAKRLARGLKPSRITHELVGLVVFGAVLAVTSAFSFWPGGSIEVLTGMYLKVLLIVVLMANAITTPARLVRFTWLVVAASGYLSARAVADYVRGVNLVEGGRVAGAVSGIFGNPNDLALNMVAFLPFALFFALSRTAPRPGAASRATAWNVFAGACAALMLLATVFTKSRSGFLGMVVMLVPVVWAGRRMRPGLGTVLVVALVASVPVLPTSFWQRMGSIVNPAEDPTGSREARRQVMAEAFQVFLERPLTGIGPGQFKNYNPPGKQERWREAHDVWLQVASETGIGGLLAFSFLVVSAFEAATTTRRALGRRLAASAWRRPRRPVGRRTANTIAEAPAATPPPPDVGVLYEHATALVAALWGWMVCAIFASVAYNWTFYYLLGLCIATRDLARARLDREAATVTAPVRRRIHAYSRS